MDPTDLSERLIARVERLRLLMPTDRRELKDAVVDARGALLGAAAVGITVALAVTPNDRASAERRRVLDWASTTLDSLRAKDDDVDTSPLEDLSFDPVPAPREDRRPRVHVPSPREVAA